MQSDKNPVPPPRTFAEPDRMDAPDAGEIEWAGGLIPTPPAPSETRVDPGGNRGDGSPNPNDLIERDTAVNGSPNEGSATPAPAEGGDEVPPPAEGSPRGRMAMDYKKLSFGLGIFSIAFGAVELIASRRFAHLLKADGHEGVVKAFGAREIVVGVGLLQSPAHATRVWNRVAGDGMDMGALALAARNAPRSKAIWGAIAFVAGAAIIDVIVACGLDSSTGRTAPARKKDGGFAEA